jgi:hypothetical protein
MIVNPSRGRKLNFLSASIQAVQGRGDPTHHRDGMPLVIVGFEAIDRRRGRSYLLRKRSLAQTGSGPHVMNQLSNFDIHEFLLELVPSGWIAPDYFVVQFLNCG